MTKVSIQQEINLFLEKNKALKSLPEDKILSIMAAQGIITREQASEFLKNSAFDKGFSNRPEVLPKWSIQESAQNTVIEVLSDSIASAGEKIDAQDKSEGLISKGINLLKETFNTENKKSGVENEIAQTKVELAELEKAETPEEFNAAFKKARGVDFSPAKIWDCQQKADEFNRAQSIKDSVDTLKIFLDKSTINNVENAGFRDANDAILTTFNTLGVKNKNEINNILKDIETAHKDDDAIKKYGGDFRIAKNKSGKYTIYRTTKTGLPAEATMEELQIIAQEMKLRLNRAYSNAIGVEVPENATNKELEELTQAKYTELENEYKDAFKEAYGDRNLKTMSDNYIKSQKQNTAYVETAIDFASIATMFMGSGLVLKGASLLTKSKTALTAVETATNIATKAVPVVAGVQVTRPVELLENLTAQEPDWESYGMSVAEGAMWMVLGMATGAVGDKARIFLGEKGLSAIAKNSGKSIDQLIQLYKSGHKLPATLQRSLSLIENTAKISGTSAEFAADILATYAIQKSRGEDLHISDYVMSANGALIGTVMHNTFAKISDAEKIKVIQKGLLEANPSINKKELDAATQELLDIHRIIENRDFVPTKLSRTVDDTAILTEKYIDANGKEKLRLNKLGEARARDAAEKIHEISEKHEKSIVKLMEKAGFGIADKNMKHRPKSVQSLYDKIKNALTDTKNPATLSEAINSVRDSVGTRTELMDFDYKKHPDIVEMYKKDPAKAVEMASERQAEEYYNKIKTLIEIAGTDKETALKALKISNYMGANGIPYLSAKQVAELQDFAAIYEIDLHVKDNLTQVRASGYTALQMNFVTKDGHVFEWQLRGSKVNKFAECEHVPYDIREGKDVTGGRKFLENLYEPLKTTVKGMPKDVYKQYNKYLTAHYEHLRKLELGFESTAPKLEDYGLTDPKLKAENLEFLHDLADRLKNGDIDEATALKIYDTQTAPKINIPPGKLKAPNKIFTETDEAFKSIVENRSNDFKALLKITNMDEFIQKGAAIILKEMGLEGAPIKIEITDNLNEFSMDDATLRVSRNWTGEGHTKGAGNKAEILGAITHELNHYLQNKEIYLNMILRPDDFQYKLNMSDECQDLMLWGLGIDNTGSAKFPYPIEQPDYYFNKANDYLDNFLNYVEPYKMKEVNGKKVYIQDQSGNYIIDFEAFDAYQKQLVEAESNRRGNIVRDAYKKLTNS